MFKNAGTSKYLGKTIDGWKVVERRVSSQYQTCQGSHSTFILKKKRGMTISTMQVSDREINLLVNKGKPIIETIRGKKTPCASKHLHREAQNTIVESTNLFNLFKRI